MQPKISRRQKIAIIVMAAVDVIMLVLAIVLDSLRESFAAEYILSDGDVMTSHPLDRFGLAVAVALVVVTVMFAFALISIISSDDKKRKGKIVGFSVLFAASVAVVMFSYFWVRGTQPQRTRTYDCTDGNSYLLLVEENYSDDFGTLRVFVTNQAHDDMALLAATDIHSRSESSDDCAIDWLREGELRIIFLDGDSYRSIQIDLTRVLDSEQQQKFMTSDVSAADDHDHE